MTGIKTAKTKLRIIAVLCALVSFVIVALRLPTGIAEAQNALPYPTEGLGMVSIDPSYPQYAVRLECNDQSVWGPNSTLEITDLNATQLNKITLDRGNETYNCTRAFHNGKGVIYRFPISQPYQVEAGDKITIPEDFIITIPENETYSPGAGERSFSFGKELVFVYGDNAWTLEEDEPVVDAQQYPMYGIGLVSIDPSFPQYAVRLECNDQSVWGPNTLLDITDLNASQLSKVTLLKNGVTYTCNKVFHNGKGVIYRFPIDIPYQTELGDKFVIAKNFVITLPEDATYSPGAGTRIFTYGKEMAFFCDGSDWMEISVSEKVYDDTVFTYITAPVINGSSMTVKLKSAVPLNMATIDDDIKEGVSFNGKTIATLLSEYGATVITDMWHIILSMPKSVFKFDGTDTVVIEKNRTCFYYENESALKTRDDETFAFSAKLNRFELVPDEEYITENSRQVTIELIEYSAPIKGTVDAYQEGSYSSESVWITFMNRATTYPIGQVQSSLETLSTGRLKSTSSEMINYEYAKQGVFKAIMDYLFINGKTIREWMEIDAENGSGELISLTYLNTINSGKVLSLSAAIDPADEDQKQVSSALGATMGCQKDMSIELKAGFVTPSGLYLAQDMYYEIKSDEFINLDIGRRGNQSRFRNVTKGKPYSDDGSLSSGVLEKTNGSTVVETAGNAKSGGCSGSINAGGYVFAGCFALAFVAIIRYRRKENK